MNSKDAEAIDQLIASVGKFDGNGFDVWIDHANDCLTFRSGIIDIIEGRPAPNIKANRGTFPAEEIAEAADTSAPALWTNRLYARTTTPTPAPDGGRRRLGKPTGAAKLYSIDVYYITPPGGQW